MSKLVLLVGGPKLRAVHANKPLIWLRASIQTFAKIKQDIAETKSCFGLQMALPNCVDDQPNLYQSGLICIDRVSPPGLVTDLVTEPVSGS